MDVLPTICEIINAPFLGKKYQVAGAMPSLLTIIFIKYLCWQGMRCLIKATVHAKFNK